MDCKVVDCETNKLKNPYPSITFHKLPSDAYFQKTWVLKCGRKNITKRDNFYVCSAHFTDEDFDLDYYNKKKLKSFAIPSKNLPTDDGSEQNIFMSSLEAVDVLDAKANIEQESCQKFDQQIDLSANTTTENIKLLQELYRHLHLEFEILDGLIKEQEATLLALKKENSKLNEYLATKP